MAQISQMSFHKTILQLFRCLDRRICLQGLRIKLYIFNFLFFFCFHDWKKPNGKSCIYHQGQARPLQRANLRVVYPKKKNINRALFFVFIFVIQVYFCKNLEMMRFPGLLKKKKIFELKENSVCEYQHAKKSKSSQFPNTSAMNSFFLLKSDIFFPRCVIIFTIVFFAF